MINALKYLVYRDTPAIGGAELIAGFREKEDAVIYADQLQNQSDNKYYVKELKGEDQK